MPSSESPTSLQHYYLFWLGQQISSFGSSLVSFAIIWWITITTESAFFLALSSALTFGSMMLVQFVSGYFTDYFKRSWILGLVDFFQAVATGVLMIFFLIGSPSITIILVILAIRGLFDGLHAPAKGAIIPSMVPKDKLQKVNSISSATRSAMNLFSPPLAALLVSLFADQFWLILSLDLITFLIAVVPLFFITIPDVRSNSSMSERLLTKLTGGMAFLRNSRGLMPLLIIFATFNLFITPATMLTPLIIMSDRGFATTAFVFALSMILFNLSFLIMSLILTRYTPHIKETSGVILGFSIAIVGLTLISISLTISTLWLYLLGNFTIGLGFPVVNVYSSMIWQKQVPNQLQGRIISVRMIVTTLSLPLAMIVMGLLASSISFALVFLTSTIGFSFALVLVLIFSDFRKIGMDTDEIETVVIQQTEISSSQVKSTPLQSSGD